MRSKEFRLRKHTSRSFALLFIISLNLAVFILLRFKPLDSALLSSLVLSPANLVKGNLFCLITAGFIHEDVLHLVSNMLGIYVFGMIVERRFGTAKTLFIYFGALALSMFFSMVVYSLVLHRNVSIIGASGALMGLISCAMLADPFYIINKTFLPIPVMLTGWAFIYADILGFLGGETDGVSHIAHLLGFMSIAILVYFLDKTEKKILRKGLVINVFSFGLFFTLNWWVFVRR